MSSLCPDDALAQLKNCRVCGSADLVFAPVLGDALAAGWELSAEERVLIDLQQGLRCKKCGANLRMQTLAGALLALHHAGGTFVDFCQTSADFRQRRVLEINSAGTLHSALRQLPHHQLASYPEVDLQRLPYADGSWDVVIHSDTLEHVPDPALALRECWRVLRPGGWLAFTIPVVHGRLTRSTEGRPPTWHGAPDTTADDWRVCTEYGADFYTELFAAGFSSVQMHTLLFPASIALVAVKCPPRPLVDTGERFIPGRGWGRIAFEHLHRYSLAAELAAGRTVLDIASGEGYGSRLLASRAAQVIGVDIAKEAVAHARAKYHAPNLEFRIGSANHIPLDGASVDLAVSFETLEHTSEQETFVSELKRVLRPDGLLLISTPNTAQYAEAAGHDNPFHQKELTPAEFDALLRARFSHVAMAGQRFAVGSVLTPGSEDVAARHGLHVGDHASLGYRENLDDAVYLVAACSEAPLPPLPLGVFVGTGDFAADLDTLIDGDVEKILGACPLAAGTGLRHSLLRLRAEAAKAEERRQEEKAKAAARLDKLAARVAARDAELQRLRKSWLFKLVRPLGKLIGGW